MTTPNPSQGISALAQQAHQQAHQTTPPAVGKSATANGIIALVLSGAAFVTAPFLLLIPVFGFLPAVLAGVGIAVAWTGLCGSTHGTGTAVTGLIFAVVLFALLASLTTVWNIIVVDPAIRDYAELHAVIAYIQHLVFGS